MNIDYINRQVDLELLQSIAIPSSKEQSVTISNVNRDPKMVTGIQKAVQRYISLLLTVLGDVKFDQNVGNTFLEKLVVGAVNNFGYLEHLFNVANINTLRIMNSENSDPIFGPVPDDEKIISARLVDINADYTNYVISLVIEITTASGDDYVFIAPVSISG